MFLVKRHYYLLSVCTHIHTHTHILINMSIYVCIWKSVHVHMLMWRQCLRRQRPGMSELRPYPYKNRGLRLQNGRSTTIFVRMVSFLDGWYSFLSAWWSFEVWLCQNGRVVIFFEFFVLPLIVLKTFQNVVDVRIVFIWFVYKAPNTS